LTKPCLKGEQLSIRISEDEILAEILDCQNVLYERFTLSKGSSLVRMLDLKERISKFWQTKGPWSMALLGKGYFEFVFSSLDDLSAVRSIGAWNLSPGFLRTFGWTADFNPHKVQQTIAQTWIRLHGLFREYWRKKTLFEIAGALGTHLALDEATSKRTFGHYARVLIEVDLTLELRERILVERKDFDFYVDVEFQKLPPFCKSCQIVGHSVKNCKYQIPKVQPFIKPITSTVEKVDAVIIPPTCTLNKMADHNKTVVEIDPLIDDIIRYREVTNVMFVGLNHEEEVPNISVGVVSEQNLQVDDFVLAETQREDQHHNKFPNMLIVGPWGDAVTDADYIQDSHSSQENFGRSMVVTNPNLSNFSSNVIHDMQVLGLVPNDAQQVTEFLSQSWSNMAQNDESVDLGGNTNQPFQLVVPRKAKSRLKKQQTEANKGFKVSASNRTPR